MQLFTTTFVKNKFKFLTISLQEKLALLITEPRKPKNKILNLITEHKTTKRRIIDNCSTKRVVSLKYKNRQGVV